MAATNSYVDTYNKMRKIYVKVKIVVILIDMFQLNFISNGIDYECY